LINKVAKIAEHLSFIKFTAFFKILENLTEMRNDVLVGVDDTPSAELTRQNLSVH
jgi:hypothetical protein